MKNLILTCIVLLIAAATFAQTPNRSGPIARDIPVKEFARLMKEKPGLVLDVRTPGEVKKGAIAQSVNLDIFSDTFEAEIDKLDKTKPVYVYCASGGRSGEAMEMMQKKGFAEVYNLAGGYNAWKKAYVK